jgi:hypothetical protein
MYRIKDWALHFENSASRKVEGARWLPLPNKHDGKGFRRISRHTESERIFCAWILILQVASKCPVRGDLADENGPLTAIDLADATGFREEIFDLAFQVLTDPKIGWLEVIPWPVPKEYQLPTIHPDRTESRPDETRIRPDASGRATSKTGFVGAEGKGREGKGTEEKSPPLNSPPAVAPHSDEVTAVLKAYPKTREREGGSVEKVHVGEGDRTRIAAFMTANPDYPLLEAVKLYAKSTRRPLNPAGFLSNPTAREIVLAAQPRDSPQQSNPAPDEPIGPSEEDRRVAATIAAKLIGHGRKEHAETR